MRRAGVAALVGCGVWVLAGAAGVAGAAVGAGVPVVAAGPAPVAAPSRAGGATTALIVTDTMARPRPGSARPGPHIGTTTDWSGEPEVLLVLGSAQVGSSQWLRVLLPIRPDGTSGWIPRNDVVLGRTDVWITLRMSERMLLVYHRGALVRSFRAVIGKPATPTPHGLAAIYERDRQADPGGFLGPWALPLTALSPVLTNFGGGPGRVAIHGRGGASLADPLGSARSHGCIRIDNAAIDWLAAHVAAGTPVQLTG